MKLINLIQNRRNIKLLSILIICTLIFANFTVLSNAADNSTSTTGVSVTSTVDDVTLLLTAIGVLSLEGTEVVGYNQTLTRAEFAKMLVMISPYKDLVAVTSYSSPYRDVAAKNWAASYIRIAANNGLMSGYSDGTFRPGNAITLEQGVDCALKLLGYTHDDFSGAFPYAQMNIYQNNGLANNITGGIGTLLTKKDAANLLYNLLGITIKDGTKTYVEKLGYALNANGEVDYAGVITTNMQGPYIVESSDWASDLGLSASGAVIYKNGSVVTASDVATYDVLYYSPSKTSVWVYNERVTGIYEKAYPNQNAVTSVMISGMEYTLESTAAFAALASGGTLKIGSAITILIGKSGGVVGAVSNSVLNESVVLYVTETGSKTFENTSGNTYTSTYIKGINSNGTELIYPMSQSWIDPGDVIKISFDENYAMKVSNVSSNGTIYGLVDAEDETIGSTSVAANVILYDTNLGNYIVTSMSRLDGIKLSYDDILYYEITNDKVTYLLLDQVTGDTMKYGVVTSAVSNNSGFNISGTYKYEIDGVAGILNTQNSTLNISKTPALFYGESGAIDKIRNLSKIGSKITSFTGTQLKVQDTNGTYKVSPNVKVYTYKVGIYQVSSLKQAQKAYDDGNSVSFYYDQVPSSGGQIRVIVYQ